MRLKIIFLISVVVLLLSACGVKQDNSTKSTVEGTSTTASTTQDKGFIGYVVKIDGDRILVVSPDVKDYSSTGGPKNYYPAIWFDESPSNINVGMKVEVWAEGGKLEESYPAQGKAERVSVISDSQSEGTKLFEAEAVNQAISSLEIKKSHFNVVKEVKYDPTASVWTVYVLNDNHDGVIPIQVSDK
ncbi:YobA family protein [Paenibacillus sp. sptzw28]|uniref:YobA family protein n=1 Tax=Paenibacillus sp. sptzw28 TaxID=715179 RepID=UPI001C6E8ED8|nr:YobA family protein [Paenibacillus sp. sptzw28]QYR23197.1 YobA family protein [Paenibacillus sp. sptzw28]